MIEIKYCFFNIRVYCKNLLIKILKISLLKCIEKSIISRRKTISNDKENLYNELEAK